MGLAPKLSALAGVVGALALASSAAASPSLQVGIHDDAWLAYGPGTLAERLDQLDDLGVSVVRFNLRWNDIAATKPRRARDHADPAYRWNAADDVLRGLRAHGIGAIVGLVGTPRWANGGRAANWAPARGAYFATFARAAASRYPWVRRWLVWNEPNQRRWLRPTSASVYVQKLLNPAYAAIKAVIPGAKVAGGVTAPRAGAGGVSPMDWIRGMRAARARLDAYAHHPYPLSRFESPSAGGCRQRACTTVTLATIDRLLAEVSRQFGAKRIWLTEYGYQTNPPDRLGVPESQHARYLREAINRARRLPRVDVLVQFLYRDEPDPARWQSGLLRTDGTPKPALAVFRRTLQLLRR
jgi:hypothetical protein